MKTIAKEEIDIFDSVVFDDDGVRRRELSDGFRVCPLAARRIKKGEEVEFLFMSNDDFWFPEIKQMPINTASTT
jgi:hypothetical protein